MVPGLEASGFVAPSMTRPVLTASRPSHTMQTTGPDITAGSAAARAGRQLTVFDEARKEGFRGEVGIVLFEVVLSVRLISGKVTLGSTLDGVAIFSATSWNVSLRAEST